MNLTNQSSLMTDFSFTNKTVDYKNIENYPHLFLGQFSLFRIIFLILFFLLVILSTINRVSFLRLRI